jgi:putative endonuclease
MNSTNKSQLSQNIGCLGEELVAQWLEQQGFQILARRWRCFWGEIDVVALLDFPTKLAFVEVKTRRHSNWDAGGLLAITPVKQAKIKEAAALFLSEYPDLSSCACQFDVALVNYLHGNLSDTQLSQLNGYSIAMRSAILNQKYTLYLQDYIESAFD